ncbi:MAG TPA: helix-turn-helix transcriptional regulator [Rhizobiaceae bacterium]|nr:helix-turn-helix transcriptional regulator [Rhizobiaceae bacterium]
MAKSIHTKAYGQFVELLRRERLKAGLTQQDVADRLGKPQSYVAKIEGAERRIDVIEFLALTEAIGTDAAAIVKELQ